VYVDSDTYPVEVVGVGALQLDAPRMGV
jgi:hypothetical protein